MTHEAKKDSPSFADEEDLETSELPEMQEGFDDGSTSSEDSEISETGSPWRALLYAVAPLLVIFFGAARELWALSLAFGVIGVILVVAPPQRRLPLPLLFGLLAFVLAPLTAWLPGRPLHAIAPWRDRLLQEWGIPLGDRVSAQPGVSAEAWVLLVVGLLWLAACIGQRHGEAGRRIIIRLLAFGASLLALLSVLEQKKLLTIPWWPRSLQVGGEWFGPFANRNHVSSLCAIAAVLCAAAAYDAYRKKSRLMLVFAGLLFIPLTAILVNTSRGGLLLFFLGMTAWLGTSAMRRGFFRKVAVSSSVVIIVASMILVMGGNLSSRFSSAALQGNDISVGRLSIYQETLSIIASAPWMGVGLGNFEYVFPHVTNALESRVRYVHPESDFLWLLTEGGLLTMLPCLFVGWWLLRSTGPWFTKRSRRTTGRQDRRLRNAAAICAVLALLHGLLDVPNHNLGYAMVTSLLLGIAIRPRRVRGAAGLVQIWGFRVVGVAIIGAAAVVWGAHRGEINLPGARGAAVVIARSNALTDAGAVVEGSQIIGQAMQKVPLAWAPYYRRAGLNLYLGRSTDQVLQDFGRARAVEPHYAVFCLEEGKLWVNYLPEMAVIPWREYLRRNPRGGPGRYGRYREMLSYAVVRPELRAALWHLADTIALKMEFLISAQSKDEWERCLREVLKEQPDLQGFDSEQRVEIFNRWRELGSVEELLANLESRPVWREDGWRILADEYSKRSDFKGAYEMAAAHLPLPVPPATVSASDVPQMERAFVFSPTDPRRGIELYYAQRAANNLNGALLTLEKISGLPNAPLHLKQEMAAIYAQKGEYRQAWELMTTALNKR